MKKYLNPNLHILILSFFILFSCISKKSPENNYESVVLNYDGEKMLIENHKDSANIEHVTISDSLDNVYKRFKLIDTLKNGIEIGYYKSGNIKYESNYINDTLQGKSIWYYDDSTKKIKSIYNYKSGRIVENPEYYDEIGNLKND